MKEAALYDRALKAYGRYGQTAKAAEELGELASELGRVLQGDDSPFRLSCVAEEIADVRIMLEQMERFYGLEGDAAMWREFKLGRLEARMEMTEQYGSESGGGGA